jgi:4-aminobutyrate aminotransferase-like enzyme
VRVPPPGFLRDLRTLCDAEGWLLIADEVFTGFGRTGRLFACERDDVVPDLLCVGKGLASGMPLSACIGRAAVMDAWPESRGEALHTQTFLGHPPSCAAGLAALAVLDEEKLVTRAAETGARALAFLAQMTAATAAVAEVRGAGLMIGIECTTAAIAHRVVSDALARGVILLPGGDDGRTLTVTPPLTIGPDLLLLGLGEVLACLA